ncbi:MAG: alpha/beta fold hydrolase, partial [Alphaproteobacteria bacterium]
MPQPEPTHEPIVGRYINITSGGLNYRIFFEEAGEGVPLICLHTAGTDSRQFRHVLNDPDVTSKCRVIAFDMPYHGRSNPPENWWLTKYQLTTDV